MKITPFGKHLYQLNLWTFVNAYFVLEEDGFTLIDCLIPGQAGNILTAAADLGQPIKRITLTHAHTDHVGCLDALKALLPSVEVILHERTARFTAGDPHLLPEDPQVPLKFGYSSIETRSDRKLQPGDVLGSLKMVAARGHTPEQVAFLDTRSGALICGDAYHTVGGVTVISQFRWRFPLPYTATWHKPTAAETGQKLLDLEPSCLAPGHGPLVIDPDKEMEAAVAAA